MKHKEKFSKHGIDYIFEKQTDKGLIYTCNHNGLCVGWIAFKKVTPKESTNPHFKVDLNVYRTPNDEAFGRWAWQCFSLEDAEKRVS